MQTEAKLLVNIEIKWSELKMVYKQFSIKAALFAGVLKTENTYEVLP